MMSRKVFFLQFKKLPTGVSDKLAANDEGWETSWLDRKSLF